MLAFADTGQEFDLGLTLSTVLWAALAFDAAIALGLGMLLRLAHLPREARDATPLTAVERRVRAVLIAFTLVFALGAVAYAAGPVLNASAEFFRELPLVANSVVKVTMLALLCGYAAASLRRDLPILGPIIAVHVLSVLVSALYLVTLDTDYTLPLFGADVRMNYVLWGAIALDGVIAAVFFVLARSAWNARHRLAFFSQMQLRALVAVGDVLVAGPEERVPPDEIAGNVDRHLAQLRAQRRWLYKVVLATMQLRPLLELLPPLSEIGPDALRRFLEPTVQDAAALAAVGQAPDAGHDPDLPAAELRRLLRRSEVVRGDRLPAVQRARPQGSPRARAGSAPAEGRPGGEHRRQGDRDRHLCDRQRRRRGDPRLRTGQAAPGPRDPRARARTVRRAASLHRGRGRHDRPAVRRRDHAADRGLALHRPAGEAASAGRRRSTTRSASIRRRRCSRAGTRSSTPGWTCPTCARA